MEQDSPGPHRFHEMGASFGRNVLDPEYANESDEGRANRIQYRTVDVEAYENPHHHKDSASNQSYNRILQRRKFRVQPQTDLSKFGNGLRQSRAAQHLNETTDAPRTQHLIEQPVTEFANTSSYRKRQLNLSQNPGQSSASKRNSIMLKPFSKNYLAVALEHNQKVKSRKVEQVASAAVAKNVDADASPGKINTIRTQLFKT